ncbi:unnamed protein product [Notodromas monacha]|uniref:Uncharacterized protein n=1 Tax=Notodromas monacha TaxID=399045 RepID=A0A7R9BSL3_9CRUS|nr:unnamed protein product [Notodromas monacha]CAG0920962.1 unnamed protein product [Notodromas monacha]
MELGYLKQFTIHGMAMNNVPYCMMAVKNSTDAICVGAVKQKRLNDTSHDFQCSCKPACSYEYTAAKFSVHEIIIGQNWETVRRTYLKLNIYFAAFDSVMAREEAQYSVFSLAGNFGGAASLMLGLSGVTILEVFTLLWDIGFHMVTNRGNKSNTSTTSFDYNTRMPAGAGHAWGGPQMVHPALKQPAMAT